MKVYIFFCVENGIKKISLMFVNEKLAERFGKKHRNLYMEVWEAIT